jgi:hypothetical protein
MILSASVFFYALRFPGANNFRGGNVVPGPAFFPQLLAIVIFAAAAAEMLAEVKKRRRSDPNLPSPPKRGLAEWLRDRGTHNAAIVLTLMFAFPFLIEPIGFAVMGALAVFVVTWRLRAGVFKSAIFAVVSTILTIYFFKYVFYIDFPPGIWSPT